MNAFEKWQVLLYPENLPLFIYRKSDLHIFQIEIFQTQRTNPMLERGDVRIMVTSWPVGDKTFYNSLADIDKEYFTPNEYKEFYESHKHSILDIPLNVKGFGVVDGIYDLELNFVQMIDDNRYLYKLSWMSNQDGQHETLIKLNQKDLVKVSEDKNYLRTLYAVKEYMEKPVWEW